MNDPEKTQPLLAQETEALEEELLENVTGGGKWLSCCIGKPSVEETSRPPIQAPHPQPGPPPTTAPGVRYTGPVDADLYHIPLSDLRSRTPSLSPSSVVSPDRGSVISQGR